MGKELSTDSNHYLHIRLPVALLLFQVGGAYNSIKLFGDKGSTTYWIRPLKVMFPSFVKITPIEIN